MSPKILVCLTTLALAGCASSIESSKPPESEIHVDEAYSLDPASPPRLAVVVGTVAVSDSGGVAKHLGGMPGEAAATYRAFFAERLPLATFELAHVSEVRVFDPVAYDRAGTRLQPADGTRVAFDGFEPDLVLFLDTLYIDRASYAGLPQMGANGQFVGGTGREALRLDTDMVLWDNQAGREVASGRLDSARELGGPFAIPNRRIYEAGIGEFVEQLARFTPVNLRKEEQRRARPR